MSEPTKVTKGIDAALAALRAELLETLSDGMSMYATPGDFADQHDWSPEFFDHAWEVAKARGTAPIWLLYLFDAAVRAGDIIPATYGEIYRPDAADDGEDECENVDFRQVSGTSWGEENVVNTLTEAEGEVHGMTLTVTTSFAAVAK